MSRSTSEGAVVVAIGYTANAFIVVKTNVDVSVAWVADYLSKQNLPISSAVTRIEIVPKGAHHCKACGGIVTRGSADVLCAECAMVYGHSLYSEL